MLCTKCTHEHSLHSYQSFLIKETNLILHQYLCNEVDCLCETKLETHNIKFWKRALKKTGLILE